MSPKNPQVLLVFVALAVVLGFAGCSSRTEQSSSGHRRLPVPSDSNSSPNLYPDQDLPSIDPIPDSGPKTAEPVPARVTSLNSLDSPPVLAFVRSSKNRSPDIWVHTMKGDEVKVADTDENLYQPTWSPNAKLLAYNCGPGDTYDGDICILDRSGREEHLTNRAGHEGSPSFSPDGRLIAFAWSRMGSRDLYTVSVADGSWTQITHTQMGERSPAWSPNGKWIAHVTPRGLAIVGSDGAGTRSLIKGAVDNPDWSPDNEWIVYEKRVAGGPEIFKMHVSSLREIRLTDENLVASSPSWSPNGQIIALSYGGKYRIATVPASGGRVRVMFKGPSEDFSPEWAP